MSIFTDNKDNSDDTDVLLDHKNYNSDMNLRQDLFIRWLPFKGLVSVRFDFKECNTFIQLGMHYVDQVTVKNIYFVTK